MNDDQILKLLHRLEDRVESICLKLGASVPETTNIEETPNALVEVNIINPSLLQQELHIASAEALATDIDIRFQSWTYKWYCNVFNTCDTTYHGRVFAIRKSTGEVIQWNLMESATKKDHGLPFWSTSPYYKNARDTKEVPFGFGTEDGRSRHVSTCINCYANWGSISFRWDASA